MTSPQIVMALGFAAALAATLRIGRFGLAMFFLIALIETFAGLRYPFHSIVRDAILGLSHDIPKRQLQFYMLVGSALVCGLFVALSFRAFVRLPASGRWMALGVFLTCAMLVVELISLHQVDRMIYYWLGPATFTNYVYLVAGLLVGYGALIEFRSRGGGS